MRRERQRADKEGAYYSRYDQQQNNDFSILAFLISQQEFHIKIQLAKLTSPGFLLGWHFLRQIQLSSPTRFTTKLIRKLFSVAFAPYSGLLPSFSDR